MEIFTLEQAEDHVADLRGMVDRLAEVLPLDDSQVPNTPTTGATIFSVGGQPAYVSKSGMTWNLQGSATDATTHTVTQASLTNLSSALSIKANDPAVSTCYRIYAWGDGTWGSTQQPLTFEADLGANSLGNNTIAGTALPVSQGFRWGCWVYVICTATGAGGTAQGGLFGAISVTGTNLGQFTANSNSLPIVAGAPAGAAWDTTANQSFRLRANWQSTTGAPTITCEGTTFERLGP